MSLDDDGRAAMRAIARTDLREAFDVLVERHSSEIVEIAARLSTSSRGVKRGVFARGMISASDFKDDEQDEDSLWFGLYAGALVYICGETNAGKSSLLYNVFIHMARNEPLWGVPFGSNKPLKVLYIDPENSADFDTGKGGLSRRKVIRIDQGRPELLKFHDGQGVDLSRPEQLAELEDLIIEEKFAVVVADPIINLLGTADENDNAEAGRQFAALKGLVKRTQVCFVAVHHTGKVGDNFGRGASARHGMADVTIAIRTRHKREETNDDLSESPSLQTRDDLVRVQMVKNRREPGLASIYLRMAGNDQFQRVKFDDWKNATNDGERKSRKGETQEDVYHLLLDLEWHADSDIRAKLVAEGIGHGGITNALKALTSDKTIEEKREGKGHKLYYRLAKSEPTTPKADSIDAMFGGLPVNEDDFDDPFKDEPQVAE